MLSFAPPRHATSNEKSLLEHTILKTQRLHLEHIGEEHKSDLFKLLANPEVHKFFPSPLGRKEAEAFFDKIQLRYQQDGFAFWAVIRTIDNAFLGICGLLSQQIEGEIEIEVGYRLSNEYWGQGYGTEAARACIDYAQENLHVSSIISLIRSINLPSIRVAEKNGLKLEKEVLFHDLPHLVYRLYFN